MISYIKSSELRSNIDLQKKQNTKKINKNILSQHYKASFGTADENLKYFTSQEIATAKWSLEEGSENWRDILFDQEYKRIKENDRYETLRARDGSSVSSDKSNLLFRSIMAVSSLGLSELINVADYITMRNEARNYVNKIAIIRTALENERLNKKIKELKNKEKEVYKNIEQMEKITQIKQNQIKPKLLDTIQREREGMDSKIPNCIMLNGNEKDINEELINWTKENINCNVRTINYNDSILKYLKMGQSNYANTGNHTLLHIRGFDNMLDITKTNEEIIESIKSILNIAAKIYHTTIIFSTTKQNQLDNIALQPHRITIIDTNIN